MRRRAVSMLALGAAALGLLGLSGCTAWRLRESVALARLSEPFQQKPVEPALRLLIVGDSTAVGTGASQPQRSLAGLIAADFPRLQIDNVARDGAKFADLATQLPAPALGTKPYDVVLVMAGGNDVIRLAALQVVRQDIDAVIHQASQVGRTVVVMPSGNVGNAPFFFAPLSWWMTQRSRAVVGFVAESTARHRAVFVRLFQERDQDPFVRDPSLHARDGLHPSDSGYALWWQELQSQTDMPRLLAAAR